MTQMSMTTLLDRLMEPVGSSMTPEFARELVGLRAAPDVQERIDDLAEKCNDGALSPEERSEYEGIVQAIHLIGILQRKARRLLADGAPS